ncbi:MAG: DUF1592 domain-containing protein [Bdellovibrionales bacterium]|nr:DUF1592 domain-containing protein [Bdellovibrionales bacterium]
MGNKRRFRGETKNSFVSRFHVIFWRLSQEEWVRQRWVKTFLLLGLITGQLLAWNNCSPFQGRLDSVHSPGGGQDGQNGIEDPRDKFNLLSCTPNSPPAPSDTIRLTKMEIIRTVTDLFGDEISALVGPTLSRLPEDLIDNEVSQFGNVLTQDHLNVITDLAVKVGQEVSATNSRINALLSVYSPCQIANVNNACVTQFIQNFGLRVWRRPISSGEVDWLRAVYDTGIDAPDQFGILISALIAAPEFSSHWELGTNGQGDSDKFEISQFELASRLSYGIWGAGPDANLISLAQKGQLSDPQILDQVVTTMLIDPKAKEKISQFFTFWLNTSNIPGVPENPQFLDGIATDGLREEMKRELDEYLQYIVFDRRGNYHELMSSRVSFARTPALAQIYGHELAANPSLGAQQMGGDRKGLLLRGPFLISTTDYSHPITRGVLLRKRILCDTIGAPSPLAFEAQQQIVDANQVLNFNNRQRVTAATSPPQCLACHGTINPIGFALESFDSLGRWRSKEVNYDANHQVISEHSLDLKVEDLAIDYQTGESAESPFQLVDLIANSDKGAVCLSRQIFRFYHLRNESAPGDACEVLDTHAGLSAQSGSVLDGIKKQILNRYLKLKVVKR